MHTILISPASPSCVKYTYLSKARNTGLNSIYCEQMFFCGDIQNYINEQVFFYKLEQKVK